MNELSAEMITARLTTRRLGRSTLYLPVTGSTNDMARQQARAGAADGALVVTDEQTAGRGRFDRRWWAPQGACLLLSLVLREPLPLPRAAQLTMCLGLGAIGAIEQVTGLQPRLKWPNDLVLDGRKLGGMLTELETREGRVAFAVLGLGLNVNLAAAALPGELAETATSLQAVGGAAVDRLALLVALLAHTEAWYDRVCAGESIHGAWQQHLDTLDRRVRITAGAAELEGIAVGVTPEGGLLLRDDAGEEHVVWSGDVLSARPL